MPDFSSYVREHLPPLRVSGAREAEVIEELALEFEESYERALANGSTPEEAWRLVVQNAPPWRELAVGLQSELRDPVSRTPIPEPASRNGLFGYIEDVCHDLRCVLLTRR
jgi:hypothetical protein